MRVFKKGVIALLMVFVLVVSPVSAQFSGVTTVEAATVKISKTKTTLYVGNTSELKITGTTKTVTWKSSDTKVVTVNKYGVLTGVAKGTATVTATVGGKTYKCTVTIKAQYISKKSTTLESGDSYNLVVNGALSDVTWYSSDEDVAVVDQKGFVVAKKEGTAIIVAKFKGKKYKCTITVKDKAFDVGADSEMTIYGETSIVVKLTDVINSEGFYYTCPADGFVSIELDEYLSEDEVKLVLKPKKAGTTSFEIGNSDTGEKFTLAVTYAEPVIVDENELTAKEIYALCSKSVVQVNTDLGFGSGFFIESNLIVTNYHVIEGAQGLSVTTTDGIEHEVVLVMGYDPIADIAILAIDAEYEPLKLNTHLIENGDQIYTIGSSLGLANTISDGLVSSTERILDGIRYIQLSAPISSGNSGSPLLNEYGEVIGINSMTMVDGQNLNFAINSLEIGGVSRLIPSTTDVFFEDMVDARYDYILQDYITKNVYEDTTLSGNLGTCQYVDSLAQIIGETGGTENTEDYYKFTITEDNTEVFMVGIVSPNTKETCTDTEMLLVNASDKSYYLSPVTYINGYYSRCYHMNLNAGDYYIYVRSPYGAEQSYYSFYVLY